MIGLPTANNRILFSQAATKLFRVTASFIRCCTFFSSASRKESSENSTWYRLLGSFVGAGIAEIFIHLKISNAHSTSKYAENIKTDNNSHGSALLSRSLIPYANPAPIPVSRSVSVVLLSLVKFSASCILNRRFSSACFSTHSSNSDITPPLKNHILTSRSTSLTPFAGRRE